MNEKFYVCPHCGNLIGVIHGSDVPVICCGEKMKPLTPNTTDAAGEKHLPVVSVNGSTVHVNVGSVNHPMLPEHFIEWIYLETEKGGQRISLKPGDYPEATFVLGNDKPAAVYAYCNLHSLWMTKI